MCSDIASAAKHLSLDRPKVDAAFRIHRAYAGPSRPHRVMIAFGGNNDGGEHEPYDLVELCNACVEIVGEFMTEHEKQRAGERESEPEGH